MTGISTAGAPQFATPAYSQITGTPSLGALASLNSVPLATAGSGGVSGVLPIANGGTGQTTAANAFNALSPMTAAGDMIYGGTAGAATRLPAPSAANPLIGGSVPSYAASIVFAASGFNVTITGQNNADYPLLAVPKLTGTSSSTQPILGIGTGQNAFDIGWRGADVLGTTYPLGVPVFRSRTTNSATAFDVCPNGTGAASNNFAVCWADWCNVDVGVPGVTNWQSVGWSIGAYDSASNGTNTNCFVGAKAGGTYNPGLLYLGGSTILFTSFAAPGGAQFGQISNAALTVGNYGVTHNARFFYGTNLNYAQFSNTYVLGWGPNAAGGNFYGYDTGLTRNAAGAVQVTQGSAATYGGLIASYLQSYPATYASLPSSPAGGMIASVTDANVTFGTVSSGGGSNKVPVWYNGSSWQVLGATSGFLSSSVADQTISGGANVTTYQIASTSGFTLDCGKCPQQYWSNNNGALTIAAPALDGNCILDIENGTSAGAITLSGFTKIYWSDSSAGSGTQISDTASGHTFRLTISRNRGRSFATVQAGQ